jgi:hypothetical protein
VCLHRHRYIASGTTVGTSARDFDW